MHEIQSAMYRERGRRVILGTSLPIKRRLHWPGANSVVSPDPELTLMQSSAGLIPATSLVGFQFVKPIIAGVSLYSALVRTRKTLPSNLQLPPYRPERTRIRNVANCLVDNVFISSLLPCQQKL